MSNQAILQLMPFAACLPMSSTAHKQHKVNRYVLKQNDKSLGDWHISLETAGIMNNQN
jgi:hypothetical protein